MEKLDTYNRVHQLQSQTVFRVYSACFLLLIAAAILCLLGHRLFGLSWEQSLSGFLAVVLASLMIYRLKLSQIKRCRFCYSRLDTVTRPLLLTPKLLSLEGKKHDKFFYTQRSGTLWTAAKWVRLSNQSLVCHHCRLIEESYREVQEPVSEQEIAGIFGHPQPGRSNIKQSL